MSPRVLIVGGGLAGLAASVALADQGFACTVIESRPQLGGRASSFLDPVSGVEIDNCQHVTLGCCTNFRHFCQLTGIQDYFQREPCLYFVGPDGRIDEFRANSLPAPLHLSVAFARLSYLSLTDKIGLARGLKSLARPVSDQVESMPFLQWLREHGQSETAIHRFWLVVLVSALSESLDRISVRHARKVFVDAFLAHQDGWYVDIPTVPLEELYGGQLMHWMKSHGTEIHLQSSARQLDVKDQRVVGVESSAEGWLTADEYVVALPFFRLPQFLPKELASHADLQGIKQLEPAPISSIHLWLDRQITPLRHAVLVDRLAQWVFNRTAIGNSNSGISVNRELASANYYQIVISASHDLKGREKEEIQTQIMEELASIWPAARDARVIHSRQVTEHRAVFSPVPGVDSLRPVQQSPIANLQFAGDWTQTGWPATMEGAVRSGFLAAENILRKHGYPQKILQADLPTAPLSRWLFGLP